MGQSPINCEILDEQVKSQYHFYQDQGYNDLLANNDTAVSVAAGL